MNKASGTYGTKTKELRFFSESQKMRENRIEKLFKDIMAKNFSDLMKHIKDRYKKVSEPQIKQN